jgi:predicted ABC-type transport system involved in lysophospholipase L1 biosynthesis ATPase subunit
MTDSSLLEIRDLRKTYPTDPGREVLAGLDLRLERGRSVAVVGPSGCGKSTLLNLIAGLDRPDDGSVELEGRNLADLDERRRAELRNRLIGMVFQDHHLLPQCTVWENLLLPALPAGRGKDESLHARAKALLERVDLANKAENFPGRLSGGERQRVAVVRALMLSPKLLLADEPTGSLDRHTAEQVARLLFDLNAEEGCAMILVTHAESLAAQAQRLYRLVEGRLENTREPQR